MSRKTRGVLAKSGLVLAVVLVAFLASGVILAQSSADFDLGCRADLTAGGTATDYPGVGVRMHSSMGGWGAGRTSLQGSGIIVQSGYILATGAAGAASAQIADAALDVDNTDDVFLPTVYALKAVRFVRPCNWPWTIAVQTAP